jgi:hypothetical protein
MRCLLARVVRGPSLPPMMRRTYPAGFIVPAQPVERAAPPSGGDRVHEIKHDGTLDDI